MPGQNPKYNLDQKRSIIVLSIIAVISVWLFIISFFNSKERVFWASINNNLSTSSITREVDQHQPGLIAKRTLFARSGSEFGVVANINIQQQAPNKKTTNVETENITTPKLNIARYKRVGLETKGENNSPIEYNNFKNKWFTQSTNKDQNLEIIADGLGLSPGVVAGTPPFVLLSNDQKSAVFDNFKVAYKPDLSTVQATTFNNKDVYKYQVSVDVYTYLLGLNKIRKSMGFKELSLNPEDFKQNEPFNIQIIVGVSTRQIYEVTDVNSRTKEVFKNHGLDKSIKLPNVGFTKKDIETELTELFN